MPPLFQGGIVVSKSLRFILTKGGLEETRSGSFAATRDMARLQAG